MADQPTDSAAESLESASNDPIDQNLEANGTDQNDEQLDDTLSPEHYDASDLRVLEGLSRAHSPWHVHRFHRSARPAPPGL